MENGISDRDLESHISHLHIHFFTESRKSPKSYSIYSKFGSFFQKLTDTKEGVKVQKSCLCFQNGCVRVTETVKERTNMFGLHYFYFQVRESVDLFW